MAIIPKGFAVSGKEGEQTIENGLVIYDTNGAEVEDWSQVTNTTYNQWVWIPVSDVSQMYIESVDSIYLTGNTEVSTKIYSRRATVGSTNITRVMPGSGGGYKEPDLVLGNGSEYDALNYNVAGFSSLKNMAQDLSTDYKDMLNSIRRFGGFYIGRYELTGSVNEPTEISGTVLDNQDWYNLYKACKTIGNTNDKIETRMIWGCQWDAACKFINTRGQKVVLDDSRTYGNYSNSTSPANVEGYGTTKRTGYTNKWSVNNIYDLAGNCSEFTQEKGGNQSRTYRGSHSVNGNISGNVTYSVSYRNAIIATDKYSGFTTRPTMYIRTTPVSTLEQLQVAGTYVTKKTTVYDNNGNKVVVPQGFKIASDSGKNVTEGIVIEDNDIVSGIGNNRGNQYVWIPVSNIKGNNNADGTESNLISINDGTNVEITLGRYEFDANTGRAILKQRGVEYAETTSSNYASREAYRTANYNNTYCYELSDSRLSNGTTTNTTAQNLKSFIESVRDNNGYYIARYEASYSTDSKARSKVSYSIRANSSTSLTNGMLWNFITQPQAAARCQSLYTSVNSDLVNSYAWDTALVYIQAMGNDNYANQVDGNGVLKNTGTTGDEKCKINDMKNNEKEWTTEFCEYVSGDAFPCINRGGYYYSTSRLSTSSRNETKSSVSFERVSFRPILWL